MGEVYVDLAALTAAGGGIADLVDELDRQPVDDIDCDEAAVGHSGLADQLETFCGRWQIGVTNLATDGKAVSELLLAVAAEYGAVDDHNAEQLRM